MATIPTAAFTEIEQVRELAESIIPDKKLRQKCLSIFADSIEKLNSVNPELWGVQCNNEDQVVRLYAGHYIVMTIEKAGVWIPLRLDWLEISKNEKSELHALLQLFQQQMKRNPIPPWKWDSGVSKNYRDSSGRIVSHNGFYRPSEWPFESHNDDWPLLRHLHFAFLDRVAERYKALQITSRRLDQPAVISYLKHELDRNIPSLYVVPAIV